MKDDILKIGIILVIALIILNAGFWLAITIGIEPLTSLYQNGLIIKIAPLNTALLFVHGSWVYNEGTHYHATTYKGKTYVTAELIADLNLQGYSHIWGTWCYSGDEDYMVRYADGTEIAWPSFVSRNKTPGETVPLFIGGFLRI